MSRLGNLFNGGQSDSNDALKYSAPKEPKARSKSGSAGAGASSAAAGGGGGLSPAASMQNSLLQNAGISQPPTAAASNLGPSKIMASATVRLYKTNAATGAYEAVEGGNPLGCVVMGTGTTFQILVYNGQKVPQATVPITAAFDYTVRDLYMSFTDSAPGSPTQGSAWSLLFDGPDVMTALLRTVSAVTFHVAAQQPAGSAAGGNIGDSDMLKRALPPNPEYADSSPGGAVLTMGMSAGLYLQIHEVGGDIAEYPGDAINAKPPLKRVLAPDDVIKVKLNSGDEMMNGLSTALVGCKKGDRILLGVSPNLFYKTPSSSKSQLLSHAQRTQPSAWLFVDVTIAKMKSSSSGPGAGAGEVERKAKTTPAVAESPPSQSNSMGTSNGDSSLKERMARVAGSGGAGMGGQNLASIMNQQPQGGSNNNINNHNNNNSGYGGGGGVEYNGGEQSYGNNNNQNNNQNNNFNNNNTNNNQNNNQNNNFNNNNNNNNFNNNNDNNNNGMGSNSFNGAGGGRGSFNNNGMALAVVEGQGARSFYLDQNANTSNNNNNQFSNRNNGYNNNMHGMGGGMQPQQQGMMYPNGAGGAMNAMGGYPQNPIYGGMGMPGMPGAGAMSMDPQANAAIQGLQQQIQLLQQQQATTTTATLPPGSTALTAAPGTSLAGLTATAGASGGLLVGASKVRLRAEELVSTLQYIVKEHEEAMATAAAAGAGAGALAAGFGRGDATALRATIARLEEKNETLQLRTDKLMTEKGELLEKHMKIIQSGSESSGQIYALQAECERLREDKKALQRESQQLREAATFNSRKPDEASQLQVLQLEARVSSLQNEVAFSAQQRDAARRECEALQTQAAMGSHSQSLIQSLQAQLSDAQKELATHSSVSQSTIQDLRMRLENAQSAQNNAENAKLAAEFALHEAQTSAATASSGPLTESEMATRPEVQAYLFQQVREAVSDAQSVLKVQVSDLQAALQRVQQELQEEKSAASKLRDTNEAMSSHLADMTMEAHEAKKKLDATELELERSKEKSSQSDQQEAKTAELSRDLAAKDAKIQELAGSVGELQEKLAVKSEELARAELRVEAAVAAAAERGAGDGEGQAGRVSEETLRTLMQDVYAKACEVFVAAADGEAFSAKEVTKKLKTVLKAVTTQHTGM